jgi:glutamyl-tRNA synthetase
LKIYPDESPYNEGKYGPYTQSEKKEIYQKLAHKLIEEKKAYYCFCTQDELLKNRNESIKNNFAPKYNRKCLNLTNEQIKKNLNKKMPYVIRLKINDYSTIE